MTPRHIPCRRDKTPGLTRRRALTISGAALGLTALPFGSAAASAQGEIITWHGIALGAAAQMQIVHSDRREGENILEATITELRRLEAIFSLYDETSDLSRLNQRGFLNSPPSELVEVLSTSLSLARISGGAFDPSIQVLWERSDQHTNIQKPLNSVLRQVGYRHIEVSARQIKLQQSAMALSLNGIAQGYITDRVVSFLEMAGLHNALVDTGEIFGAGRHPAGRSWQVAVAPHPDSPISCMNQAVATSSGSTFQTGVSDNKAHIFDPSTGMPSDRYRSLSVMAPTATLADGLSTTLSVLPEEEWGEVLKAVDQHNIRVFGERNNGTVFTTANG